MSMAEHNNILIVDDELPIRTVLSRYLEKAGYNCKTAENANDAKKLLQQEPFSLLLTDLKMPGESGLDLIKYAREHYPRTGRIMVTAMGAQDIAKEIMDVGVYGYIVKPISKETVLITVENALRHLSLDQDMQACVDDMAEKVTRRSEKLDAIMNSIDIGVLMVDPRLTIMEMNRKMREWFAVDAEVIGKNCYKVLADPTNQESCEQCPMAVSLKKGISCQVEKQLNIQGETRDFRIVTTPIFNQNKEVYASIALYEDMTERLMIERDLQQAQKLEAVGQLAAGIAHEINTPIQYVGDNLSFLKDSFEDIIKVLNGFDKALPPLQEGSNLPEKLLEEIEEDMENADLDFLKEEVPVTINQSLEGVRRVDKIVKAMKDFSHPGEEDKTPADINKIIETTLTVCKNEWKYVAEVDTNFSPDLPPVPCFPGDLSQVFLNIIVNAAHAISEATDGAKNGMGRISIMTAPAEDSVEIQIRDTGGGIPKDIQDRVFNPFFTTKSRGKGTGQGLAIAHRVVVNKHQGSLSFQSQQGEGTTFLIKIPTS